MENTENEIIDLKISARILRGLVDTILDNTKVDYSGETLTLDNSAPVLTTIKTFFPTEYSNCLKERVRAREAEIEKLKEVIKADTTQTLVKEA